MYRRELRRRRRLRVLALVLGALAIVTCVRASPVFVASPTPGPAEAAICRSLVARLPDTLDRRSRRDVTPASGLTAAWGRPTITLACGVAPDPHPLSDGEICFGNADGSCAGAVQWFRNAFDSELFTTRVVPRLAVVVPGADGLADVLPPISAVVLSQRD